MTTVPFGLEEEFGAELHEARGSCADNLAESGAVDVAVDGLRAEELRVVENIKGFDSELERLGFCQADVLEKSHIVIVHPRAVEEAAAGGAQLRYGSSKEHP